MNILNEYVNPGLSLLPENMRTDKAKAMIIAIGLQESEYKYRTQIGGPARGFHQFEQGGIKGVLNHPRSKDYALSVCKALKITPDVTMIHYNIAYNDALDCAFARLLLWTLPSALPGRGDIEEGWKQYLSAWRPGKPRPEVWQGNFKRAWEEVKGDVG